MYLPLELVKKNKNCRILPNEIDTEKEKSMLNTQCTFQNILHFFLIKKKNNTPIPFAELSHFFFFYILRPQHVLSSDVVGKNCLIKLELYPKSRLVLWFGNGQISKTSIMYQGRGKVGGGARGLFPP